jgi:transcription elongation factor GreB
MSKAFTREGEDAGDDEVDLESAEESPLPAGAKNYMTPVGWRRMRDELTHLVKHERPEMTSIVSWAAKNGDRSENGDYLYGKKRLREIDRRIRYLTKRLENAEVVDPATREETDQVFFGATVTYAGRDGRETTVCIVGIDETDFTRNHVSWISPIARALIKAHAGDAVVLHKPDGNVEIEILEVKYEAIPMEPFVPVKSGVAPNSA